MLTFHANQMYALDRQAGKKIVGELVEILSDLDGAFLPRFPSAIRHVIVENLVERSYEAGAESTRAIMVWCGLMCTVAPNLGSDAAVRAWKARTGVTTDAAIAALPDVLAPSDWERIEAHREDLPLFTPTGVDSAPIAQRVARALPIVLWDRVDAESAPSWSAEAVRAADVLGLGGLADAPVALAAMAALYGTVPDLRQRDWVQLLEDRQTSSEARLAMLRARIMLDHGRWA